MLQSLYIAGSGPGSGKSVVVLGLMENLASLSRKIGFFRPVVTDREGRDSLTDLIVSRYNLPVQGEMLYGCTGPVVRNLVAEGRYDELMKRILDKYKQVEQCSDLVVCVGTDYRGVTSSLEFDFNADLANNLGCRVVPVVTGHGRQPEDVLESARMVKESLQSRGCEILALLVNRVPVAILEEVQTQIAALLPTATLTSVLPEHPSLQNPTIAEIAKSIGAHYLCGGAEALNQVVARYRVAAMEVGNFLDSIEDQCLIITPGDRSDILLASILADVSTAYPRIAGLVLTGGWEPPPSVQRLLDQRIRERMAILLVPQDTFTTALNVSRVEANLLPGDERKIAAALGLMETHVDTDELRRRIRLGRSTRVTPIMFEYELIRRAQSQRRHIVLPEGNDERVLRAAESLSLRDVVDLTLLGPTARIRQQIKVLGLKLDEVPIIDPAESPWLESYAET